MSLDLQTVTTFWRKSGGEYNQHTERAIISIPALQRFVQSVAGQALLDSADGEALKILNSKFNNAIQQRDELLAALKGLYEMVQENYHVAGKDMAHIDCAYAAITKAEQP